MIELINDVSMNEVKLLQKLPLRVDHLKQNNTPKLVKAFTKSPCPKIKSTATSLMNSWLTIIRETSGSASTTSEAMKRKKEKLKAQKMKAGKDVGKETGAIHSKPPPVSKAPSFAKFRKTGLEREDDSTKRAKLEKTHVAGKRSSLDSEDITSNKKAKTEPKVVPKKIAMSGGFMDALNSIPAAGKRIVKRKPLKPKPTATSPVHKPSPTHDMHVSGEAGDFGTEINIHEHSPSPVPSPKETSKPKLDKYGKPQKKVTWAVESKLESVRYFEVEEGERGSEYPAKHGWLRRRLRGRPALKTLTDVKRKPEYRSEKDDCYTRDKIVDFWRNVLYRLRNRGNMKLSRSVLSSSFEAFGFDSPSFMLVNVTHQSFKDAMQRDKLLEREKLGGFHHKGEGSWRKPPLIDLPPPLVEVGCNSIEKDIQAEREKTVLQEIFLSLDMVPDSPAEPDPEPYDMVPPKIIPLDDPNEPAPVPSPTESPESDSSNAKPTINGLISSTPQENGKEVITDKLREILQSAAATTKAETATTNQSEVPTEPGQGRSDHVNVDPNATYPPPGMMPPGNGYFPQGGVVVGHQHPMMPPPHMLGGDQYTMDWNGPPRPMGAPPPRGHPNHHPYMGRGGPRMPPFRPGFNNEWEPRRGSGNIRRRPPRGDYRGNWSYRGSFRR